MTKLSIITINYNNVNGLKKTIESVVSQTCRDFEYIVIDGGSTDGSVDVIKNHDNKINFWISEPDNGIYNAMNKGVLKASGDYLLFLNSGDWLLNDLVLDNIYPVLNTFDIIYFDIFNGNENKKELFSFPDLLSFYFLFTTTICQQAIFFKSSMFSKFGLFREDIRLSADWEFLIRMIVKEEVSYKHIKDCFSFYDDGGITANINNKKELLQEREDILKNDYKIFYDDFIEFQLLKFYFNKYKLESFKNILVQIKNSRIFTKTKL